MSLLEEKPKAPEPAKRCVTCKRKLEDHDLFQAYNCVKAQNKKRKVKK